MGSAHRLLVSGRRVGVLASLLTALVITPVLGRQQAAWSFSEDGTLDGSFEVPIDVAVHSSGLVVVSDVGSASIKALELGGTLVWEYAPPPGEPGYLERVGVVAISPSGEIVAYDERRQRAIFLTPEGQLVREPHLPFALGRLDDIVFLADGNVALSGRTRWEGKGAHEASIHVFSGQLDHVRSFGPVPDVRTPELQLVWGTGSLRAERGRLLLGLKIPYELAVFSTDGVEERRIQVQSGSPYSVDDIWVTETSEEGRITRTISDLPVEIPSGALQLDDGVFLSQRSIQASGARYWDIIDDAGSIAQSIRVPEHWLYPAAAVPDDDTILVIGTDNDEPAVLLVTAVKTLRSK